MKVLFSSWSSGLHLNSGDLCRLNNLFKIRGLGAHLIYIFILLCFFFLISTRKVKFHFLYVLITGFY